MIKSSGCTAPLLCHIKTETLWWNCLICNSHEILNYVKQYVDLCRYSQKEKNHTEIHNWHHLFMLRICFSLCGSYLGALSTPICQGQWLWFRLFSVDVFHVGTRTCSEAWEMGTGGIWGEVNWLERYFCWLEPSLSVTIISVISPSATHFCCILGREGCPSCIAHSPLLHLIGYMQIGTKLKVTSEETPRGTDFASLDMNSGALTFTCPGNRKACFSLLFLNQVQRFIHQKSSDMCNSHYSSMWWSLPFF